jgi:ATP-binding cassette subfamily F protein uup
MRQRRTVAPPAPAAGVAASDRVQRKSRKRSYKEQRELDSIPQSIQVLETRQRELQAALADPKFFRQSPAEASAALERLQALAAELEAAYARWDALESADRV